MEQLRVITEEDLAFCEKSASCRNFCPYICDEHCSYSPMEGTLEYEVEKLSHTEHAALDEEFAWEVYNFVSKWKNGGFGIISLSDAIKIRFNNISIIKEL